MYTYIQLQSQLSMLVYCYCSAFPDHSRHIGWSRFKLCPARNSLACHSISHPGSSKRALSSTRQIADSLDANRDASGAVTGIIFQREVGPKAPR